MGRVVGLQHEEGIRLDAARLAGLVRDLGGGQARAHVDRVLADMARSLDRIEGHYRAGEMSSICRLARALSRRAGGLGMSTLSRVASDVALCARRRDMVAFAATWTRLQRIAERSHLARPAAV